MKREFTEEQKSDIIEKYVNQKMGVAKIGKLYNCGETLIKSRLVEWNVYQSGQPGCERKGEDLSGIRFGRLVVLMKSDKSKNNERLWVCRCDCGNVIETKRSLLKKGSVKSCGCYKNEISTERLKAIKEQARIDENIRIESLKNEIIFDYRENNFTKKDIGAKYKIPYQNVGKILDSWKVEKPKVVRACEQKKAGKNSKKQFSPEQLGQMKKMYEDGMSLVSIGREFNVAKSVIARCLKMQNITLRSPKTMVDITGKRFGKLIALEPTDKRDPNGGNVIWKCKCDCGNIVETLAISLIKGNTTSCGCIKSLGENKIESELLKIGCPYKKQFTFDDCRSAIGGILRFDFSIFNEDGGIKCLIEYDGIQHETGWRNDPESLKANKERDAIKNKYCQDNGINLIRINYRDYDKISEKYLKELIFPIDITNE